MKEILSLRNFSAIAGIALIGLLSTSCSKEEGIAPISESKGQTTLTKLDDRTAPSTEEVAVEINPAENAVARTRSFTAKSPTIIYLRADDTRPTPTMPVIRPDYKDCLLCELEGRKPVTVDPDLQGFAPVR